MFQFQVVCPSEKWTADTSGAIVPRAGDELMYKNKLYSCGGCRHLAHEHRGEALDVVVAKVQIFVSPLK